jgi:thymidylate synthase (FAD)
MRIELLESAADDLSVVNAARVSLDNWHNEMEEGDDKLIGFLMRERHGTPFEHSFFKFRVEAPIFVFREWQRHRVGHSYNEMSGRYTEMEQKFYRPDRFRAQKGKPGAYFFEEIAFDDPRTFEWAEDMDEVYMLAWETYQKFLREGMAKEQARAVLPVGLYSKMIWSCNARSLMHFCGLRNAPQALKEIRDLAAEAENALYAQMPITQAAFVKNGRVAP